MIKLPGPDIARHIGVQQLPIHIEGRTLKTNPSLPLGRQPPATLGRLDQTHSCLTILYALSWEWPTRCPDIACDLDEEHHMSVCIVMCVVSARQAPALRFIPAKSTSCT